MRIVLLAALLCAAHASGQVRLNDIRVIGSHNSYHAGLAPNAAALLKKSRPDLFAGWDYRHPPLNVQLDSGVRQVEIDVFADPKGGLYSDPLLLRSMRQAGVPADPPFDPNGVMKKPGFKVFHVQDYDFRSTCQPFIACLTTIRDWSKAHPGHLPIFILIENKDENPNPKTMTQPVKMTSALFDALDEEIRSVFSKSEVITPDTVRGSRQSLESAVLDQGWPLLEASRGKVIFLMDQSRLTSIYSEGHPSLKGRVLFTNSKPGTPETAFVEVNDPYAAEIPDLVRNGYLIRTRTDAELVDARAGKTARRDQAMASGAQLLSTDFPFNEVAEGSGYSVRFEKGNARCNPVRNNPACTPDTLREGGR